MLQKNCDRVRCRNAHVIPGTEDPSIGKYIVINSAQQTRLPLKGDKLVSSCIGKVGGAPSIISVSSSGTLYVVGLNDMQVMSTKQTGMNINLVRYFDAMPDTIFTASFNPQTNQSLLTVMLSTSNINCEDIHQGHITDIFFTEMSGQKIVFTACTDFKVRGYLMADGKLVKQVEHPTSNTFVTKFI